MKLYDLLVTMQGIKIELHIYKNWTFNNDKKCEEVEMITGSNTTIFVNMSLNRYYLKKYDMNELKVFYIGKIGKTQTLRINCEYFEGVENEAKHL